MEEARDARLDASTSATDPAMTDLFLIAHKVRGEPAFDVAARMRCPECEGHGPEFDQIAPCHECDSLGYWWIVPTSGHRAYPWWSACLTDIDDTYELVFERQPILNGPGLMPASLPDHYTTRAAPHIDLTTALGLRKPAVAPPPLPRRL